MTIHGRERLCMACERTVVFLTGAFAYSLIEILYRGYTHWSMGITGGLCYLIMYLHFIRFPDEGILTKCFFGMVTITSLEFITGCIVNILLGWHVWDYSHMFMNFLGQICLAFSAAWFLITVPVVYISEFMHRGFARIFSAEKTV
ncbi:MAG: hypothetical protein ACI4JJ_07820 [Huintestinicola sp.]